MRITDHIDLFYPNSCAKHRAAERRKTIRESGTGFTEDLQLENIRQLITFAGSRQFMALAEELSDYADTINY